MTSGKQAVIHKSTQAGMGAACPGAVLPAQTDRQRPRNPQARAVCRLCACGDCRESPPPRHSQSKKATASSGTRVTKPACMAWPPAHLRVNTSSHKVTAKMWKCHHVPWALRRLSWSVMSKLSHVALSHSSSAPALLWCPDRSLKPMQWAHSSVWGEGRW